MKPVLKAKNLRAKIREEKSKCSVQQDCTIVVVDDEHINCQQIEQLLVKKYQIVTAENGEEAINKILSMEEVQRSKIKVIISDYMMPVMNGTVFLERVKEIVPLAKRILISGQTDFKAVVDAVNYAEIFRYISKPFHHEQLILNIETAISRFNQEQLERRRIETLGE